MQTTRNQKRIAARRRQAPAQPRGEMKRIPNHALISPTAALEPIDFWASLTADEIGQLFHLSPTKATPDEVMKARLSGLACALLDLTKLPGMLL